jgi:hypothetical protein
MDQTTWNGKDLGKLQLGIWNYICPCSTHEQCNSRSIDAIDGDGNDVDNISTINFIMEQDDQQRQ